MSTNVSRLHEVYKQERTNTALRDPDFISFDGEQERAGGFSISPVRPLLATHQESHCGW